MKKFLLGLFSILMIAVVVGCTALSQKITPGHLDEKAKKYTIENGVADPNDYKGYQSLEKLMLLQKNVNITYEAIIFALDQEKDKQKFDYARFSANVNDAVKEAQATDELLFGQTGLLSMILPMVGLSGCTGLLGLYKRKPGDISPEENKNAITEAINSIKGELAVREKQFTQVVKGVDDFMKKLKDTTIDPKIDLELRASLSKKQDEDTQKAVAMARVS